MFSASVTFRIFHELCAIGVSSSRRFVLKLVEASRDADNFGVRQFHSESVSTTR